MAGAAWDAVKQFAGPVAIAGLYATWQWLRHRTFDWVGIGGLFLFALIASLLAMRNYGQDTKTETQVKQVPDSMTPGIPTLSSLLGQHPKVDFDVKTFFARAYYSTVTTEAEKNIKIAARGSSPIDPEAFYTRFIGVGLIAYWHDTTWYTVYGSQLRLLETLNAKGVSPIATAQKYYNEAKEKFPQLYASYSFEQWIGYMQGRFLVVRYPSAMIDITHHGKDFLKYMTHWGVKLVKAF